MAVETTLRAVLAKTLLRISFRNGSASRSRRRRASFALYVTNGRSLAQVSRPGRRGEAIQAHSTDLRRRSGLPPDSLTQIRPLLIGAGASWPLGCCHPRIGAAEIAGDDLDADPPQRPAATIVAINHIRLVNVTS